MIRSSSAIVGAALAFVLSACGAQPVAPVSPPAPPTIAATAYPAPQYPAPAPTAAYPAPSLPATATPDSITPDAATPVTPAPTGTACLPADLPLAPATPAPTTTLAIGQTAPAAIPRYTYRIVNTYPHDRGAFTEGLQYLDGALYEGTGLNGKSELRRVALESGAVQQSCALPQAYFGEGVTVVGGKVYQLTWQNHVGFVYDLSSFTFQQTFSYPSEGWGLTNDGQRLIMSDGTPTIHFLDPATLAETGQIVVRDDHGPVARLNELEYVRGEIYANVWQTDLIARIDPNTGQVLGWIDLAGLLGAEDRDPPVDVLNGIAYDAAGDRLFVTGKWWPKLFEIQLVLAP